MISKLKFKCIAPVKWTRHYTKTECSRQLDYFDNKYEYSYSGGDYLYSTSEIINPFRSDDITFTHSLPERVENKDEEVKTVELDCEINFSHFVKPECWTEKVRLYRADGKYWNQKVSSYRIGFSIVALLPQEEVEKITRVYSGEFIDYRCPDFLIDEISESPEVPREVVETLRKNQRTFREKTKKYLNSLQTYKQAEDYLFKLALAQAPEGFVLRDRPVQEEKPAEKPAEKLVEKIKEEVFVETAMSAQLRKLGLL